MKDFKYELIHKDAKSEARLGKLNVFGKIVETPVFMPVGTQATVKFLSPEEIKAIGSSIILSNTYHLWLRPGEKVVKAAGGLHSAVPPGAGDGRGTQSGVELLRDRL